MFLLIRTLAAESGSSLSGPAMSATATAAAGEQAV
jgi:hypothetical protein